VLNLSKSKHLSLSQMQFRLNILFLLPSIILITGLLFYPLIQVVFLSLTNKNTLQLDYKFTGLTNYIHVIQSPNFWDALLNDVIWTAGSVGLSAIIGLLLALLLNKNLKLRNFARGLILFPYVVPVVVVALVWRYIFNDLYGVGPYLLSLFGIHSAGWLSSPKMAMISVILLGTWKFFPFVVIALLSRLQIIPLEPYEAAKVDGANAWQSFRYLTWPAILPIFLLTILLRIIWTFNAFEHIYMLTGGGPVGSTTTLPILIYNKAFKEYNMGEAATSAVLMLFVLLIVTLIYLKVDGRYRDND
jgi:multiple sugar transport system permease protein